MKTQRIILLLFFLPVMLFGQTIEKPRGCFAGTNGTHPDVLSHPEARGVLLMEKWSNLEPTPGSYNFTELDARIKTVKAAGLKYALAIAGGAFGSPGWLIDQLNVAYHDFTYQEQEWRLPLWWDTTCYEKLTELITQLGNQYAMDTMLSHVYVTQMTVNGVEGHLNGVDMNQFVDDGYTDEKWISAAKNTTYAFASAFPDKPIVFEVHEINRDTIVPAIIMNDLLDDAGLCKRVGLAMWWLSGKTSYQSALLDYIRNFAGDKYAQVISRSDKPEKFQDNYYGSVFSQAKDLNIRYIEPWPYEFQHHTCDSLMEDFNAWADTHFSDSDTCTPSAIKDDAIVPNANVSIFPNPTKGQVNINIDSPYRDIEIQLFNAKGECLLSACNTTELNIEPLPRGTYFLKLLIDGTTVTRQIIKE
ncbi:T9SS type A sorting domain-containing protein [Thermophagus sp. OGC60D27]|uniref:T9SS type A sorting domain-containing protein n=1 Tax=Thermophagus sp. OGC60D27 TaxID=3458415 RepID=UPI004037AFD3